MLLPGSYALVVNETFAAEDELERRDELCFGDEGKAPEMQLAVFPQRVILQVFAGQHIFKTRNNFQG